MMIKNVLLSIFSIVSFSYNFAMGQVVPVSLSSKKLDVDKNNTNYSSDIKLNSQIEKQIEFNKSIDSSTIIDSIAVPMIIRKSYFSGDTLNTKYKFY